MLGADARVLVFVTAALANVGFHGAGGYDLRLEIEGIRRRVGTVIAVVIGIGPVDGRAVVGIHGAWWIRAQEVRARVGVGALEGRGDRTEAIRVVVKRLLLFIKASLILVTVST